MQFFLDSADIQQIAELTAIGLVDGITTNPTILAKANRPYLQIVKEICAIVTGPVSVEVIATDHPTMLKEALIIAELADNVVVKLPLTPPGLQTCKELSQRQIQTNVTLCFSSSQAILAAKAGATYVSPFVGRLDDVGQDGLVLIGEIRAIYDQYPDFNTNILAASIRHPIHVVESAKMGADVATMPPSVLQQMFKHPLTDKGLEQFSADWAKTGQTILAAA